MLVVILFCVLILLVFISLNWFQSSYFRVDTQTKWFWHEKWTTQQRQRVQDIFGSVQGSGTEVWHTHIVPELAHCCEHLSWLSATEVFSLKCDSPVWKITSPITPAASLLSVFSPVKCVDMAHRVTWGGKTEYLESLLQFFFQKHDNGPRRQRLAFFPILSSACPTCCKLNAIRRVRSSKWSLSKCYCFLNVVGEVYLWMCWNLPLARLTFYRRCTRWHKS